MSAYYGNEQAWPAGRQPSWEAPAPPSRSGTSSTVQRDEPTAFASQIEEVERAIDNLYKSGKMPMFGGSGVPGMSSAPGVPRRDSMPPMGGRPYGEFGKNPRMAGGQRHHSVSDYDGIRSHSAQNLQGFYANQRFAPRPNETDQMMQAKRRMAAQRERDLRNYHQEQQYNRSVLSDISGAKSDRSMSPNAMSEEDRRDLIARQHRALYGETSNLYTDGTVRQSSQDARVATSLAGRGPSPLAFDPFGMQTGGDPAVQMPVRDGKDSNAGVQRSRANITTPLVIMLAQTIRASRLSVGRLAQRNAVMARRTYLTPTAVRQADLVQDMYLRELKNYKPTPVKPTDAEGHVQKFAVPKAPQSPEESDLASELKEYEAQQVEVEGQAATGETAPVEEDWFEEEEEAPAAAH